MTFWKTLKQNPRKFLWWLVILGLVAALPMTFVRERTESSANNVEFVFDFRDLQDIADTQPKPAQFVDEQLQLMKKAGITSMSVYESTLQELQTARRIEVYKSRDLIGVQGKLADPAENFTYVLFADKDTEAKLAPIIQAAFGRDYGVKVQPWQLEGRGGLVLETGLDDALLRPMDPDPMTMQYLKDQGFQLVSRLSNKRPFDKDRMDDLLKKLSELGVKRIIPDADEVPGFTKDPNDIKQMADKMRKYNIGLATIEMLKEPQRGFNELARSVEYNVVRLHSFTEKDTEKLMQPMAAGDLENLIQETADRLVLAVKDRNIRMVFLNAKAIKSVEKKQVVYPLNYLYEALDGKDGAVKRIEKAGYTMGPAVPFTPYSSPVTDAVKTVAPYLLLLGGVAMIALLISFYVPQITMVAFLIGVVGAAGMNIVLDRYYALLMALAIGISASTLAIIYAIRFVKDGRAARMRSGLLVAAWLMIRSTAISLIGVVYVVSLLNSIIYFLVLDQFRGISLLLMLPILLGGLYLVLFSDEMTYAQRWERLKAIMMSQIRVLWLVLGAVAIGVLFYYLSRSGNEGTTTGIERYFRSFLENTMGVRPRTKEFLLSHPFFIVGAYLSVKYKNAVYLMLLGVIGQLSIVNTFTHLHTPLDISGLRVLYGIILGAIIGLVLIAVWEIVTRSWKRWAAPLFRP